MNEILTKYHIRADKSLGQNFLQDQKILSSIANATQIEGEHIIEVGPGYGALTEHLLRHKPASLTLVEFDTKMVEILKHRIENQDLSTYEVPIDIINLDVLKFVPTHTNYKVIANIPYYITSPILTHFLSDLPHSPSEMVILMQKEVAERICDTRQSVLSLSVAKKADAKLSIFVPKHCFVPAPKVDSQILHLISNQRYQEIDDQVFSKLIKTAFSNPRKKLLSNLGAKYDKTKLLQIWKELAFNENVRGEELGIDAYLNLIEKLK